MRKRFRLIIFAPLHVWRYFMINLIEVWYRAGHVTDCSTLPCTLFDLVLYVWINNFCSYRDDFWVQGDNCLACSCEFTCISTFCVFCDVLPLKLIVASFFVGEGTELLSGRVLDSRSRCCGFEPHRWQCIVSLSKPLYPLKSTGSTLEDPSRHDWNLLIGT